MKMKLLIIPRELLLVVAILLASCTLVVVEAFSFSETNHPSSLRHHQHHHQRHHHGRLIPTRSSSTTLLQVGNVGSPSGDDDDDKPGVVTVEMEHVLRTALENVRAVMTLQQDDDTASKDTDNEDEEDAAATLLLESVVVSSDHAKEGRHAVVVAPSTIPGAGRGLVAQQDIPAGSITGFYPVHGLGVDLGDSSFIMGMDPCDDQAFYATSSEHRRPTDDYLQYLIGTRPLLGTTTASNHLFESANALLFLNANPNRAVNPLWTSHCVNDAATVKENTEAGIVDYYQRSRQGKNCVTVPFGPSPIMATITTRDVVQGEELFTSYGCAYWIPYILGAGDEEEEMTDVTESIQRQVQESAQDLFQCYRAAQTKYAEPAEALQEAFVNKQQKQQQV
jgi:hypothetical protein